MRIRQAVESDIQDIRSIHQAAIRHICSLDYPENVISAWLSGNSDERYSQRIKEASFWVVEEQVILGFGSVCTEQSKLESLFLTPEARGMRIAAALLRHLEQVAVGAGVDVLSLNSSLSAKAFYAKHGYRVCNGQESIKLTSGVDLASIPMSKRVVPNNSFKPNPLRSFKTPSGFSGGSA
jgi:GNAT superfamily N-acetyltransferase